MARPHRGRLAAALLAMVVHAAAAALLAYQVRPIFDQVLPERERVGLTAALILGAYIAKGLASYASVYLMTDVGQRVVLELRSRLFRHLLDQSAAFFGRRSTGQLLSRVTNDVSQVQQAVSETIGDLLRESLALAGYTALLFYYDARLALVCLTGAPLVLYPLVRLGQRVRRVTRRGQEELEHLSHVAAEAFAGHRIVKAFAAEAAEAARFEEAARRLYRTSLKVVSTVSALPPLMEILGGLAVVGALWYGSRQIAAGALTPGEFAAFMVAAFMTYGPIKKLSRVNANLNQAIAASERIFELLDIHSEVRDRPGARELPPLREAVEFRGVSFSYDDGEEPILRDVSLTVRAGQMAAIVGPSGAGKTTLVNLIPRFYDVTGGAILIDGVDIRDVTLRSLRRQIAIVTQETVLFDDTIARNIAYGAPEATRAEIEAAARAANAHEFIAALPEGYDTRIGERGQRLSGGQRQRLAIARALLKNAPILILDEATSSLDAESERLVQEALARLVLDRTSFVIAHRLSTVRRADLIVVLERGRVVDIGRHEELLARPGGLYARLCAIELADTPRPEAAPAREIVRPWFDR
ncbi:MAG TPA: ABC transporter ATP-binding protein [Vicinamibacterales bacterium]|nr:ABC transporter ATP-binding protein [Vicinamibacterales bacterium]